MARNLLENDFSQANFILCEFLKKDKAWIFLHENLDFEKDLSLKSDEFLSLITRFKNGEPFEYIFKKANFFGLDFKITKGVLIPRYDSEILLKILLDLCEENKNLKVLEIGFGSGILSIILALKLNIKISACDINETALNLARENAALHKVSHLIDFKLSDFRQISGEFDLIFSNPPYISANYKLDKWVQNEPKSALIGGEKGFEILKEIIEFAAMKKAKFLACEFGYDQKEILNELLRKNGFKPDFFKDERNLNRAFAAERK